LDIFFSQFLKGLIVGYTVPNLLSNDLAMVRAKLLRFGEKLVTSSSKSPYKFHRFSTTDYTFVSTLVAKQLPHLLESKLILMHRDHIPERIVQKRFQYWNIMALNSKNDYRKGLMKWISFQSMYFTIVHFALAFGSLSQNIQNVVIYVIPSTVALGL
jgi:hypothetical protein